jgi:lipopolysaccharide/colanic/teichoic acid biosynthesis glycosyltransferase
MVRLDLHYVDYWSNLLDLAILMEAVAMLLLRLREAFVAKSSAIRGSHDAVLQD